MHRLLHETKKLLMAHQIMLSEEDYVALVATAAEGLAVENPNVYS